MLFLPFAVLFFGCAEEVGQKEYAAKVNNSYLTEEELASMVNSSAEKLFRSEVIRNWINTELLYQEAREQGILDEPVYKNILADSRRELAGALLLKDFYEKRKNDISPAEIKNFYQENINEFKLLYDSYLINKITFNNEDRAVDFRSSVLQKNWKEAADSVKYDSTVISGGGSLLLYEYEIQPASMLRIVKELYPDEVSIVLENNGSKFTIIQVLQKFKRGEIPPLEYVYSEVKKRCIVKRKEMTIKNYIEELYSKNDIEVKN